MMRKIVRRFREELVLSRKSRKQKIDRLRGWRELGDEGKKGQMAIDGDRRRSIRAPAADFKSSHWAARKSFRVR
jgi:hypothetical protein